ncbi:MAG TPA: Hint domain-containing protein [Saprospiraceae bacterium]|nr:Hint domain-containing protein [Saprospiraceae bacterium]
MDNQTAELIFDEEYDVKLRGYGYSLSDDEVNDENIPTFRSRNQGSLRGSVFPLGYNYLNIATNKDLPANDPLAAMACGALDGLFANVEVLFDLGKFAVDAVAKSYVRKVNYYKDLGIAAMKGEIFKKIAEDSQESWKNFKTKVTKAYESITTFNAEKFIGSIKTQIRQYFVTLVSGTIGGFYEIGKLIFEVAVLVASGGAGTALKAAKVAKSASTVVNKMDDVGSFFANLGSASSRGGVAAKKWFKCQILGNGCFVKDTPVLIVGNLLRNTATAYAIAALPVVVSLPIQNVQLFDYAVAHKSVNSSYGLTANTNETYVIGKDPYTSDQQRSRDQYEINDTHWKEVAFEEVNGSSSCKLALHADWITNHGYSVDAIVNMNLPEQGISGPFKIISIKHIIPQKKPVDEDPDDDWEYRPVTGLFIHESNNLWNIPFDDGTHLGVTTNHPLFSVTKGDWQAAGYLKVGEEVLTKTGSTKVLSKEKDVKQQLVYNLEVKDLHNFLVGDVGVVVHNLCYDLLKKRFQFKML